jgi:hypothetical protein
MDVTLHAPQSLSDAYRSSNEGMYTFTEGQRSAVANIRDAHGLKIHLFQPPSGPVR